MVCPNWIVHYVHTKTRKKKRNKKENQQPNDQSKFNGNHELSFPLKLFNEQLIHRRTHFTFMVDTVDETLTIFFYSKSLKIL